MSDHPPIPKGHPRFTSRCNLATEATVWSYRRNGVHRPIYMLEGDNRDDCANAAIVAWEDEAQRLWDEAKSAVNCGLEFDVTPLVVQSDAASDNADLWREWKAAK